MTENESIGLAISLVGDSGVGKTSLLNRFINSCFEECPQTVSYNVTAQKLTQNGKIFYIDYIDPSGDPYYETSCNQVLKQSQCVIVVLDHSKSLENLEYWCKRAKEFLRYPHVPFFIAINKLDKMDSFSDELVRKIEAYADENAMSVFKVSAKEGINVESLFNLAQKKVIHIATASQKTSMTLSASRHSRQAKQKPKSSCC